MTILAIRYNNPGNVSLPISGYTGQGSIVGAPGQPGYGSFPDMASGFQAMQTQLGNYIDTKGLNTISSLNSIYAQDQNWAAGVSAASGIGVNTPLDTSNAAQMSALQSGIIKQETGMTPSQLGIDTGSSDYFSNQSAPYSQQAPSVLGASASEDASGGNLQGTFGVSGPQSTSIDPTTGASIDQPVNSTPLSNTWDGGLSGIPSAQTSDLPPGASAGQVAQVSSQGTSVSFAPDNTSSGDPGVGSDGGFPLDITNAPQVGTQAASTISTAASGAANTVGQAVQSGSGQVSSALTNSTQAGIQGLTDLVGSGEQAGTDWLVRGALILAAMVLAYGAFALMSRSDGKFA